MQHLCKRVGHLFNLNNLTNIHLVETTLAMNKRRGLSHELL